MEIFDQKDFLPRLWIPGPDASFFSELKYFMGFVQLQDMLDRSIIKYFADRERREDSPSGTLATESVGVYTQQFPYPCYEEDKFVRYY